MTTSYSLHTGHMHILPPPMDTSSRIPSIHRVLGTAFIDHPATAPICRPSSDCGGSSSGLGGMTKTDIVSSDDSSLASDVPMGAKTSWQIPHAMFMNGVTPASFIPCSQAPTSSNSPSPFAEHGRNNMIATIVQRTSTSSPNNNDLFVHVQTGETLSILVGNDVHQITGPATVRMVNQAGASPAALPLHVPPGHMVQQILDEQGILRHLILSPESAPAARLIAGAVVPPLSTVNATTPLRGATSAAPLRPFVNSNNSGSPPIVPPYPPPNLPYNVHDSQECTEEIAKKSWSSPQAKKVPSHNNAHLIHVPYNDEHEQSQSGASANEDDEWERLSEMLSRIQPPRILRVGARDVDIAWQELDTSEAAASGGPFPQIDASEFSYEIVLCENSEDGQIVCNNRVRCDPATRNGNQVSLSPLRPNTVYYVHLRASLEERGLEGSASPNARFQTLCAVPERPSPPQLVTKTHYSLTVSWRRCVDNGSPIRLYRLEIAFEKGKDDQVDYKVVYEGLDEQTKISGLTPLTTYRVRLIAANAEGESEPSADTILQTAAMPQPPSRPKPPQSNSVSSKSVSLSWKMVPEHSYSLQMCEETNPSRVCYLLERARQDYFAMNDLSCNRRYHFRLVAHNEAGDSEPSEPLKVTTLPPPASPPTSPPATPTRLRVVSRNVDSRLEIGWKPAHAQSMDRTEFVLEGSADDPPKVWSVIYKGNQTSAVVRDMSLCAFRVSARRFQSQFQSNWSEVLTVKKKIRRPSPTVVGRCAAPKLEEVSDGCVRAHWRQLETVKPMQIRYDLRCVKPQTSIVYKGEDTEHAESNCAPGTEFEMQVRAVAVGSDGTEVEGEWSESTVLRVAVRPPPPPIEVRLDADNVLHWNPPTSTNGAPITEFIVERVVIVKPSRVSEEEDDGASDLDWTLRHVSAAERSMHVGNGRFGCKYQLSVCAVSAGGTSVPSECVYLFIPPDVPSSPSGFQASAESCGQLRASWRKPSSNGSEISGYKLVIEDQSSEAQSSEQSIPSKELSYEIEGLQADHTYKLLLCASNEIGEGSPACCVVATPPPPPSPPVLICAEANPITLKLKWKPVGNGSPLTSSCTYYLEREFDSGKFSKIFEGEGRYYKVRNLTENTKYRFRIRCSTPLSGIGEYSEPYEFTTQQLPPPTIRSAPTVTEVACGLFQVEWQPLRPSAASSNDSVFYRLQMAPRASNGSSWKTIYEGVSTSCSLSASETVQLRVVCVRVKDNVESVSLPSPVQLAVPSTTTPSVVGVTEETFLSDTEEFSTHNMSSMQRIQYYLFSDTHYALGILEVSDSKLRKRLIDRPASLQK